MTPQQRAAVENRGGNLLVSAAAGSGKTKVLTERLLSYILDPNDPANVDDFLIITFTKAAAAELRVKIAAKLSEAIAQYPDNLHLQKQMQRLHLAQISTVHSFCTEILREFAYKLDIGSDFRMIDSADSPELEQRVLDQVINAAYENIAEDENFRKLVDTQGYGRNDDAIQEIVLRIYNSSRCHLNPDEWLDWCLASVDTVSSSDVSQTPWGRFLIDDLHQFLDLQIASMDNCAGRAQSTEGMSGAAGLLADTVEQLKALRSCDAWDEICNFGSIAYGTLRFDKTCEDIELREQIKAVRKYCKESLDKKLLSFSVDSKQLLQDMRMTAPAVNGLVDLVREFGREYSRLKKHLRVLDFGDLEHFTLDLLLGKDHRTPNAIARQIGSRFREVMVDEYQDSNQVQDAIYMALTCQRNNCFMVGDVKQSIYQFRLADPSIFTQKYNTYLPAETAQAGQGRKIHLSNNFRSAGQVIDCVNDVFVRCMSPQVGGLNYDEDEMLREGIPHIQNNEPEISFYAVHTNGDTYAEEAAVIAQKIVELLDGSHMVREGESLRPIKPEDIAILIRSRSSLSQLISALDASGIPFVTMDPEDILHSSEISVLISLLKVISNPLQDIPLLSVLASNIFSFGADELAQLRSLQPDVPIFELLRLHNSEKTDDFLAVLDELRRESKISTVSQLLASILHKCDFISIYGAMSDGEERINRIHAFVQMASDFETSGSCDLDQFLEHLNAMDRFGVSGVGGGKIASAVQITTIHKSKGLEYPVVFLANTCRDFNMMDTTKPVLCDRVLGLGLNFLDEKKRLSYPTVAKRAISTKMKADAISEELRVLYVAMTRAKDRLIMTYADSYLPSTLSKLSARMALCHPMLLSAYASDPGRWILLTALSRTEAGELFALGGNPGCTNVSVNPWEIRVVKAPETVPFLDSVKSENRHTPLERNAIEKMLTFAYPHVTDTFTPSKQTATQIKGRKKDMEVAENSPETDVQTVHFRMPTFLGGTAGKEYGNAYHAIMQYIRYEVCTDMQSLKSELQRLVDHHLISPQQRDLINPVKILNYILSPLGRRVVESKNTHREFKFSIMMPSVSGNTSQVLLQGVVDLIIVDADGICVVDFKSDRVSESTLAQRIEEHRQQVETYCQAVERIFQKNVKEKFLYFFSLDREVLL